MTDNTAHLESLPKATREALRALAPLPALTPFYLAGGTALALHLGHRISGDLDFFSKQELRIQELLRALAEQDDFRLELREVDTLIGMIRGVKAAFFHYPYPLLEKTTRAGDIALASVRDIACMKLEAIASRGAKRDFIDLYAILESGETLTGLLDAFAEKYAALNVNLLHIKKSIVYFTDAEDEPMPKMLQPIAWNTVKRVLTDEVKKLTP